MRSTHTNLLQKDICSMEIWKWLVFAIWAKENASKEWRSWTKRLERLITRLLLLKISPFLLTVRIIDKKVILAKWTQFMPRQWLQKTQIILKKKSQIHHVFLWIRRMLVGIPEEEHSGCKGRIPANCKIQEKRTGFSAQTRALARRSSSSIQLLTRWRLWKKQLQ